MKTKIEEKDIEFEEKVIDGEPVFGAFYKFMDNKGQGQGLTFVKKKSQITFDDFKKLAVTKINEKLI